MKILGRNSGVANIWVAIALPMMVAFVGLAIDMGYMTWVGQQTQLCADASALAGAYYVQTDLDEARAAAVRIGLLNRAADGPMQLNLNSENAPEGDIVVGRYDRDTMTFNPASETPNAVQVRAKRTSDSINGSVQLLFGPALNISVANIQRSAIAMVGGGTGAGLIVLDEHGENALCVHGDVQLNVNDGAIQVNSDHDQGAWFYGSVELQADQLNCVGAYRDTGATILPDDINTGCDVLPDPLAFLPEPTWDPAADLGAISMTGGTLTIQPGYYSGGISTTGGTLFFEPGIYILDGAGFNVAGNANIQALGVMFYIVGTGCLNLVGIGNITLSPPDPDIHTFPGASTYEGVTVFQARGNTTESRITGTSDMNLEGTFYFPSNPVYISGDSMQCGNQLVAYRLDISGNGNLTINYDGRFPAPGNHVFLVQ